MCISYLTNNCELAKQFRAPILIQFTGECMASVAFAWCIYFQKRILRPRRKPHVQWLLVKKTSHLRQYDSFVVDHLGRICQIHSQCFYKMLKHNYFSFLYLLTFHTYVTIDKFQRSNRGLWWIYEIKLAYPTLFT